MPSLLAKGRGEKRIGTLASEDGPMLDLITYLKECVGKTWNPEAFPETDHHLQIIR